VESVAAKFLNCGNEIINNVDEWQKKKIISNIIDHFQYISYRSFFSFFKSLQSYSRKIDENLRQNQNEFRLHRGTAEPH
jgi:hypothetical protein